MYAFMSWGGEYTIMMFGTQNLALWIKKLVEEANKYKTLLSTVVGHLGYQVIHYHKLQKFLSWLNYSK